MQALFSQQYGRRLEIMYGGVGVALEPHRVRLIHVAVSCELAFVDACRCATFRFKFVLIQSAKSGGGGVVDDLDRWVVWEEGPNRLVGIHELCINPRADSLS